MATQILNGDPAADDSNVKSSQPSTSSVSSSPGTITITTSNSSGAYGYSYGITGPTISPSPTSSTNSISTKVAIGSGRTDTLKTGTFVGNRAILGCVTVAASVPAKWNIQVVHPHGIFDVVTLFTPQLGSFGWTADADFEIPHGGMFQVIATNLDNMCTADLYATFEWTEY